jgi:SAM-dependent methyltransferase
MPAYRGKGMSNGTQDGPWGLNAANVWERKFEPQRTPLFQAIIEATNAGNGKSLLDAGCGAGSIASAAHRAGAKVFGCDSSEAMVALAKRKLPDGDFRVADLAALPYPVDSFDIVVACDSLLSAARAPQAVRELSRVCKEDGKLAILIWGHPRKSDQSRVFAAMHSTLPAPPPATALALTGDGVLDEILADAGLPIVRDIQVALDYRFDSFEDFWTCLRLLGAVERMSEAVGEDTLHRTTREAAKPSIEESGRLVMKNVYRLVVTKAKSNRPLSPAAH